MKYFVLESRILSCNLIQLLKKIFIVFDFVSYGYFCLLTPASGDIFAHISILILYLNQFSLSQNLILGSNLVKCKLSSLYKHSFSTRHFAKTMSLLNWVCLWFVFLLYLIISIWINSWGSIYFISSNSLN